MKRMRRALLVGVLASLMLAPAAKAASGPAWLLAITPLPSNLVPGADPEPQYLLSATNVGDAPSSGTVVLRAFLPEGVGLIASKASAINNDNANPLPPTCTPKESETSEEVTCETSAPVSPGHLIQAQFSVAVGAAPGTYTTKALVSGGGAEEVKRSVPAQVQAARLGFGFLPGFAAPATGEGGEAVRLSGSHPGQQSVAFGFPTYNPGELTNDGHPRNFSVDLPRGMVGNPAATKELCTEVKLVGQEGCPEESQVGIGNVTTLVGAVGNNGLDQAPLYNMVPPPGSPGVLAENVAGAGIYAHIFAEARTDSDYGITARTPDVLNISTQPIFSVQAQIWGDPSSAVHDHARGDCLFIPGTCPALFPAAVPFLSMPADCPGSPHTYRVRADSWEEPSPPSEEVKATYESAELNGNPVSLEGCEDEEVAFEPSLDLAPTTNAADSPTGLEVSVHQEPGEDPFERERAPLRGAMIRFPAGLVANPAQAAGLGACSEAQIGFLGETEAGRLDFSKQPQSCPDAAKLGSLEATSPILVQRNEEHEVALDEEENPIPEPLHGFLYLAQPFANPFGSLVAVYLVIEDAKTGIVAKLAVKGQLDPQSGQITTFVREAPELPIEDVAVKLFSGPRAPLSTPPTCGVHVSESDLTPWSAPEGKDAFPTSAFQTEVAPGGGACPASEAALPSAPVLKAGTTPAQAGSHASLLLRLSREDGSQRFFGLDFYLPTGLSAKLAGVAQCGEAQIAVARSREVPQQGVLEQADPSCPAASELGTVAAAVGSGPTPFQTTGHAYLAGPYKGAPLSVVAIAAAVAGPFDLGTVVVRSALYLDPISARGHVVSDPLPTILDGVPVDLRSLAVHIDRQNFTLNPTSCAQKAFEGTASSPFGVSAPLFARFQVGGCKSLPYKPKLSARLFGKTNRGAHPRLRLVLSAKPGEANTRSLAFTLPRSEFIDQGHFRTICTRVQFAANQCPAGSVYGQVVAKTPLVDYPLQGPIYLRSSSHKLPDAVAVLRGPPSQPIEIDAVARIDSVGGRLRARVQTVPDAPIEQVVVNMQGGAKGLFQNSTQLCRGTHRLSVSFVGQNGKAHDISPKLKASC
jgi:hypothetical protein